MSDKEKPEVASAKCTPVLLLLFVGFIFGFIVGYGTKDIILQTLSKTVKTDIEATQKEPSMPAIPSTTTPEPVSPDDATETTPKTEDESKEEPKEEPKVPEADKPAAQP